MDKEFKILILRCMVVLLYHVAGFDEKIEANAQVVQIRKEIYKLKEKTK